MNHRGNCRRGPVGESHRRHPQRPWHRDGSRRQVVCNAGYAGAAAASDCPAMSARWPAVRLAADPN
jgi:hypothetical protein